MLTHGRTKWDCEQAAVCRECGRFYGTAVRWLLPRSIQDTWSVKVLMKKSCVSVNLDIWYFVVHRFANSSVSRWRLKDQLLLCVAVKSHRPDSSIRRRNSEHVSFVTGRRYRQRFGLLVFARERKVLTRLRNDEISHYNVSGDDTTVRYVFIDFVQGLTLFISSTYNQFARRKQNLLLHIGHYWTFGVESLFDRFNDSVLTHVDSAPSLRATFRWSALRRQEGLCPLSCISVENTKRWLFNQNEQ